MFSSVIQLYRASGTPRLEEALFRYAGPSNDAIRRAIDACEGLPPYFGRFEEEPETNSGEVTFSWLCAANEHGRFYRNVSDLVANSQSVHRGVLPGAFYLVEGDYLAGDPNPPEELERLERVCQLIGLLERLTGAGNSVTADGEAKTLLFVLPAGDKTPPKTLQLYTQVHPTALKVGVLELAPLRDLVDPSSDGALHIEERRSIFRLAVADVAASAPSGSPLFSHVVMQWDEVLGKFRHDIDCYISNFSFDRLRTELANIQTDFSAKLTKVMGDTTSRFLALPLPYVALAGIIKSDDILPSYLLFVGALVLVLLYSATVHNQQLELGRTKSAFKLVFGRLIKSSKQTTAEIAKPIKEAETAFHIQRRFLRRTLITLRVMAWVPIFGGLIILAYKFNPFFREWLAASLQQLVI